MKMTEILAQLGDFSKEMLNTFEAKQDEFKGVTVQKGMKFLEANKIDSNKAKTPKFWNDYQNQMEKYLSWFKDEFIIKNPKATKQQKTEMFFKYVNKKSI